MKPEVLQLILALCGNADRKDECIPALVLRDPFTITAATEYFYEFQRCHETARYPYPESVRKCMHVWKEPKK